ncbi:MAG: methyltransferase domain-containing protein [Acidobacteria bacterium]|nr:methyltransferase domain-containing protein [Acidobacteriota bacterium]
MFTNENLSREWDSTTYHRLSKPHVEWGAQVLERVPVSPNQTILDVGCGSGKITAELLERLPSSRVIASDLSGNMVRSARDNLLPRFAERVSFLRADMQAIPLRNDVDGVFSTAAFHWVPDHDALFANLHAALHSGGWLEAQCGGGPNLARIRQHVGAIISCAESAAYFAGWQEPWNFADAETAAARLSGAGFAEVHTWLEPSPQQFDTAADFKQYLATVTLHRHLDRIPDVALRERFLDAVTLRAEQDDPPLLMDYWRLNISARKPA